MARYTFLSRSVPMKSIDRAKVVPTILSYWAAAIIMVFVTKHLVAYKDDELTESAGDSSLLLFITWCQCLIVTLLSTVIHMYRINHLKKSNNPDQDTSSLFQLKLIFHPHILCLAVTFIFGLVLNNLMLKHIGIAFYQIARSMTLIFVVILSLFILHQKLSVKVCVCCFTVIFGYVLGADQEGIENGMPIRGLFYGVLASFIIAIGGVLMKKTIHSVEKDSMRLTFCYNFISIFILLPLLISTGEFHKVLKSQQKGQLNFWFWLSVSGITSLMMGWLSALQIKITSPTTHHISISAKSVLQTIIAVIWFQESKSLIWWTGTCLTVFGTACYGFIRVREERRAAQVNDELELKKASSTV